MVEHGRIIVGDQAGLRQSNLDVGGVELRESQARIRAREDILGDGIGVDDVPGRREID